MGSLFSRSCVIFTIVVTAIPVTASAQGTPECYSTFPGAVGKRCCDQSFAKDPRGSLQPAIRMSGLEACVKRGAKNDDKKKKKD
jgi:hypothetical protein